jgi:hypothetical protein
MKPHSKVRFHVMAVMLILALPVLSACQGGQITIQVPGGGDSGGESTTSDDLFTTQFLFVILLIMIVFAAMVAVLR